MFMNVRWLLAKTKETEGVRSIFSATFSLSSQDIYLEVKPVMFLVKQGFLAFWIFQFFPEKNELDVIHFIRTNMRAHIIRQHRGLKRAESRESLNKLKKKKEKEKKNS